jgi:hypothetical protein
MQYSASHIQLTKSLMEPSYVYVGKPKAPWFAISCNVPLLSIVFVCFVWISEQTPIISLYSINLLVFVTETECVYCAVRTEFWQESARFVMCASLRHSGPVVTICTTSLTFTVLRSAHTVYLCVLYGSQNKQLLFLHTALTLYRRSADRFI